MVKSIKQKNNELHNIVCNKVRHKDMESTSSTASSIKKYGTTSSIRRYGFNIGIDIYIMIIKMDKKSNIHRQRWKGHVHNNLADIITSMVESECTTKWFNILLKPFCSFINIDLKESRNSTSCLVDVHSIIPSKGVTTTRCIATSTTAVQRQDATTSVANHCHQQHWYNEKIHSHRGAVRRRHRRHWRHRQQVLNNLLSDKLINKSGFQQRDYNKKSHQQAHQEEQFSATSPTSSLTLSSTSSSSRRSSFLVDAFNNNSSTTSSSSKGSSTKFIENKFDKKFINNNCFSGVHRQQVLQREIHRQQSLHRVHRRQQFSGGLGQPLVCNSISMVIILPLIDQLHIKRQTTHHQHCRLRIQRSTTTRFGMTTSSTKKRLRRGSTTTTIRRRKRTTSTT